MNIVLNGMYSMGQTLRRAGSVTLPLYPCSMGGCHISSLEGVHYTSVVGEGVHYTTKTKVLRKYKSTGERENSWNKDTMEELLTQHDGGFVPMRHGK